MRAKQPCGMCRPSLKCKWRILKIIHAPENRMKKLPIVKRACVALSERPRYIAIVQLPCSHTTLYRWELNRFSWSDSKTVDVAFWPERFDSDIKSFVCECLYRYKTLYRFKPVLYRYKTSVWTRLYIYWVSEVSLIVVYLSTDREIPVITVA